jgi:hypothetical protein
MKRKRVSAERDDLIHQVRVRNDHAPAAVPGQTEVIEHRLRILSQLHPLDECLVGRPYYLAACETPDGYHHLAHL